LNPISIIRKLPQKVDLGHEALEVNKAVATSNVASITKFL
jgi:hypothetical protein